MRIRTVVYKPVLILKVPGEQARHAENPAAENTTGPLKIE
jgi:hypothetical protein